MGKIVSGNQMQLDSPINLIRTAINISYFYLSNYLELEFKLAIRIKLTVAYKQYKISIQSLTNHRCSINHLVPVLK